MSDYRGPPAKESDFGMCGICGVVDYAGLEPDIAARLQAMVATLRHRGPDQSGTWADERAGLGHARLSIIDLSDGRQPLGNEDGAVWISYNGEVYNFPELRRDLLARGHRFRTRTDTEVIVHLYEDEGIECVHKLRGMFAFGLWDARRQCLYLVRDRLGIKPLYYTVRQGRLLFGSEIKAILSDQRVPRRVRLDALCDYLTYLYVPAPKTIFDGIYKLEPGHWLRFDANGLRTQQYWDLRDATPLTQDRAALEEELRDRLAQAVRLRLISDVPLGAFLSGGIDSSSVVALMSQAGQDPLITASVGFPDSRYNELPFARQVARRYQTQHYEEMVHPDAVDIVHKLAWHFDEPFADYSSIPTYYVSQAARRHVTVALSGDGGDENFGGYRRYRLDLFERRLRRWLPAWLRRGVLGPLARVYPKADWLPRPLRAKVTLRNVAADPAEAYARSVGFLADEQKPAVFTGDALSALADYRASDLIRRHMSRAPGQGLAQLLYTDIKTYLVDDILTKVDRASMAVALEVRVPLLDHPFVEFAHRIPAEAKIRGSSGKVIFKSAMRPCLDDEILYRTKQGFTPPVVEWLRGPLREMLQDLLLGTTPAYAPYLQRAFVAKACRHHQLGLRNYGPFLWAMLTYELWARTFLQGSVAAAMPTPVVPQADAPRHVSGVREQ